MKSLQISIEGPPGSGKTTLAALLTVLLERCGSEVAVTDSSSDTFASVRSSLAHNPESVAPQFSIAIQTRELKPSRKKPSSDFDTMASISSSSRHFNP